MRVGMNIGDADDWGRGESDTIRGDCYFNIRGVHFQEWPKRSKEKGYYLASETAGNADIVEQPQLPQRSGLQNIFGREAPYRS